MTLNNNFVFNLRIKTPFESSDIIDRGEWLRTGWNSLLGMLGSDRAYQKVFQQVLKNYSRGYDLTEETAIDLKNIKARSINKTRNQLKNYPVLKTMTNIDFKITVTYGDQDIYGESRKYLRERYPSAAIVTIKDQGHLPDLSNQDFADVLKAHFAPGE